jgi:hypothetical protein
VFDTGASAAAPLGESDGLSVSSAVGPATWSDVNRTVITSCVAGATLSISQKVSKLSCGVLDCGRSNAGVTSVPCCCVDDVQPLFGPWCPAREPLGASSGVAASRSAATQASSQGLRGWRASRIGPAQCGRAKSARQPRRCDGSVNPG